MGAEPDQRCHHQGGGRGIDCPSLPRPRVDVTGSFRSTRDGWRQGRSGTGEQTHESRAAGHDSTDVPAAWVVGRPTSRDAGGLGWRHLDRRHRRRPSPERQHSDRRFPDQRRRAPPRRQRAHRNHCDRCRRQVPASGFRRSPHASHLPRQPGPRRPPNRRGGNASSDLLHGDVPPTRYYQRPRRRGAGRADQGSGRRPGGRTGARGPGVRRRPIDYLDRRPRSTRPGFAGCGSPAMGVAARTPGRPR